MALYLQPPIVFMEWYLVKHRDNFTFLLGRLRKRKSLWFVHMQVWLQ